MRTISIKLYTFNELSESARQKVLEKMETHEVEFMEWWIPVYEDAENVGIKITGFDFDIDQITGDFLGTEYMASEKIMDGHGKQCQTYKAAEKFDKDWNALVSKYTDLMGIKINADKFRSEEKVIEETFKNEIRRQYLTILRNEYEYLTSEEAIKESIEENGYEFTENGEIYSEV